MRVENNYQIMDLNQTYRATDSHKNNNNENTPQSLSSSIGDTVSISDEAAEKALSMQTEGKKIDLPGTPSLEIMYIPGARSVPFPRFKTLDGGFSDEPDKEELKALFEKWKSDLKERGIDLDDLDSLAKLTDPELSSDIDKAFEEPL